VPPSTGLDGDASASADPDTAVGDDGIRDGDVIVPRVRNLMVEPRMEHSLILDAEEVAKR